MDKKEVEKERVEQGRCVVREREEERERARERGSEGGRWRGGVGISLESHI